MVSEAGRAAGVRTLAIGYRLAPEHPFPAAFDDALTAWRYLRKHGIAAAQIAVGSDSAGGGLTVALINRLRDAKEALPGCAWLVSPWTDLTMSGATLVTKDAVDPLIHKGYLEELAAPYLPVEIDRRDPRVSPLYAELQGLPPMLIQVDPRLAAVECAAGGRPPCARERRRLHAPAPLNYRACLRLPIGIAPRVDSPAPQNAAEGAANDRAAHRAAHGAADRFADVGDHLPGHAVGDRARDLSSHQLARAQALAALAARAEDRGQHAADAADPSA